MLSVLLVCLARYLSVCISEVLRARYKTFVQMGVECKFAPVLPPLPLPLGHTHTYSVRGGGGRAARLVFSDVCLSLQCTGDLPSGHVHGPPSFSRLRCILQRG